MKRVRSAVGLVARGSRRRLLVCLAAALPAVLLAGATAIPRDRTAHDVAAMRAPSPDRERRAFSAGSWWNTPLPDRTPLHPAGPAILTYLRTGPDSKGGCLHLAGAEADSWGAPIFWSQPTDPTYDVRGTGPTLPPELHHLRIPRDARPAENSDGMMTIYDLDRGYVVALEKAAYNTRTRTWTASGGTVTYLDSNGLDVRTGRSDDSRNVGTHRGNNGATMAVSWDQVQAGALSHVLKVAVGPTASDRHIFPMVGSDGTYLGHDPAVPPEGLRLRIKASVDLAALDLAPQAFVIARALQRYGFYIGDSGGSTALKLEDTSAEGRGQLWNVERDALCGLPFEPRYWQVVAETYDPTMR